ncbi:tail fiber domain-containing protein [candidate division KSB1 bacterium]|nr:tail fiber domain-containing protein [candidate division KSB1 bacterium]
MFKTTLLTLVFILLIVIVGYADVPKFFNYQGLLMDAEGNPVNGTRSIQFSLYGTESGGDSFWTETHSVLIRDGLFNVLLGSVNSFDNSTSDPSELAHIYLEVKIADDPPMTPRQQIVSVGFAMHADDADHLEGHPASDFVRKMNDVRPVDGAIDLVGGTNVTVTPDPGNHRISISATGGSGGDNLGNHSATQNIRLNNYWLSNDGGSEGIQIGNTGGILAPSGLQSHGDIITSANMQATNITAVSTVQVNGGINVGSPSASAGSGDISVADDILVDDHVLANNVTAYNGWIKTGSPSIGYDNGDIVATDDLIADDDVIAGEQLMVVNHAGINMGTTYSTTYALRVQGNAYCTGSWTSSDQKFKKNVEPVENALSKLEQIEGVSFDWKTDEYPSYEFSEGKHYGFIAQEIEKVFPDMVKTDENGEKAVSYVEMIPILVEALKQQQKMIEQLQTQVNQLMNK